jgi:hypothetical protein
METAPPGDASFNQPIRYDSAQDVLVDFGDGSDAHVSAQALDAMGAAYYTILAPEITSVTDEVLGDSDTTSVSSGTVSNTPISESADVTVSVDGTSMTVIYVTESPPDSDTTPGTEEAHVNTDTGEVVTGTSSSGTGSGIQVSYTYTDWTPAFDQLNQDEVDVATLSNARLNKSGIGDADELTAWASGNGIHVPFVGANAADYSSDRDYRKDMHQIAGYVPSADVSFTAHKTSDDLAAYIAGLLVTQRVWEDPSMEGRGFSGLSVNGGFNTAMIGDPETSDTFEGGMSTANSEHVGPMNVLENVQGTWVLSNDLTTLGASSEYRYLDVRRTESFVEEKATAALVSLSLDTQIPFNKRGRVMIHNELLNTLERYNTVGVYDPNSTTESTSGSDSDSDSGSGSGSDSDSDSETDSDITTATDKTSLRSKQLLKPKAANRSGPYSNLQINVPPADEIDATRRDNRIWGVIDITYRINGSVHRFELDIQTRTRSPDTTQTA